ncbi:hypothetical protein POTOM_015179 [Populus tomentosa]|uniref:SGNH hydrolase-type esterase domain-containing protein n=1 Tax=Populus tomentosa TaxID=118781 RepID=A0A8X7ZZL6_POPTO|nr:hypothetical protein POTOM_015179 [Populus tomentosa]
MRPKIYLFGDSITEVSFGDGGWAASLSNHFSRTVDVVLKGHSGYNTRWALKVAERIFPPVGSGGAPTLAVTVFFGANDACLSDRYAAFQHVPLHEYKQNLHSLISFFKYMGELESRTQATEETSVSPAAGLGPPAQCSQILIPEKDVTKKRWAETVILLVTPPPIDEDARLRHPYMENPSGLPERTNEAAGAYAQICISVAKECGCPVVDLWTKIQEFPDWKEVCLCDGLHLTQTGNRIVFEEVVKILEEQGLSPENLPAEAPLFADIDPKDPLKAFEGY